VVKGFANLLPPACFVIRDGCEQQIPAEQLVIGDVMVIKNGSRVAADARILHSTGLKLETSSITGEPEPLEFTAQAAPYGVSVFEVKNAEKMKNNF
jgi:P-type E1-E2 ATPase